MKRTRIEDPRWLQVKVEKSLWQRVASEAIMIGDSVSAVVRGVLEDRFGPVAQQAEQGDTQSAAEVVGKAAGSSPVRSNNFNGGVRLRSPTTLKEDHGWCKVCHVNQVKLPGLVCRDCKEITK